MKLVIDFSELEPKELRGLISWVKKCTKEAKIIEEPSDESLPGFEEEVK